MVRSMTGFGTGSAVGAGWRVETVMRTLNHRYLSVRLRSLSEYPYVQVRVEGMVKEAFRRGEINVSVDLAREAQGPSQDLFDHNVITEHLVELRRISQEFNLPSPPSLADLIRIGAFQAAAPEEEDPWPIVVPALEQAITATTASREAEGEHLAIEIKRILGKIANLLDTVKERLPQVTEELRLRLQERIAALQVELDPARLEMEIALLVERFDIREETVRLESHLTRATSLLDKDEAIGKELDFLSQEFLREVNTLGSKSRDLAVNSLVIDMKMAINEFKEQVQNVE